MPSGILPLQRHDYGPVSSVLRSETAAQARLWLGAMQGVDGPVCRPATPAPWTTAHALRPPPRDEPDGFDHLLRVTRPALLIMLAVLLDKIDARLAEAGVQAVDARRDMAAIFDRLTLLIALQGISNAVAFGWARPTTRQRPRPRSPWVHGGREGGWR